jgi:DNA-binding GntR family transcriptional regulator
MIALRRLSQIPRLSPSPRAADALASSFGQRRRSPGPENDSSLIELVAGALRDAIVHGRYRSGERLNQSELASELGVSRIPIREALRRLEVEGQVIFDHHHGARVAWLNPEDIQDIFEIRVELEALALRVAIPAATTTVIDRAKKLVDRMDRAGHDLDEWLRLNDLFHVTLYAPSGRQHLIRAIQTFRHRVHAYLRLYIQALHRFEVAQAQHRNILKAYAAGDLPVAEAALREHLVDTMRELLRALSRQHAPGH